MLHRVNRHLAPAIAEATSHVCGNATRMPVIVHERDYDEWLLREGSAPAHLLKPFPAAEMAMTPVSKDVGNVRNDHSELLNSK